jgi:hypothetical protein
MAKLFQKSQFLGKKIIQEKFNVTEVTLKKKE